MERDKNSLYSAKVALVLGACTAVLMSVIVFVITPFFYPERANEYSTMAKVCMIIIGSAMVMASTYRRFSNEKNKEGGIN